MKLPMSQPCTEWADVLATVSLADLSPAVQEALKAHLVTCPACAAVQADYQRMDARIRALAPARPLDGLPPALLQLWAEENQQHAPIRALHSWSTENSMRTSEEKSIASPTPNPQPQHRPTRWLVSGVSALAAVVVIAILVTALVVSHGTKTITPGSAPNTATNSQGWQTVPHLTNTPGLPVIAPSNPQVVYEARGSNSLQRSDDGGATWHALPLPPTTPIGSVQFFVSPSNAQSVFVEVQIQCPTAQANTTAPLVASSGSGNICFADFFSTDGGAHWSRVQWPLHQTGAVSPKLGQFFTLKPLQAQGNRLFALLGVTSYTISGNRGIGDIGSTLVSSTDGGATWHFADQGLVSQGYCVNDYTLTPTGTTVFAIADDLCSIFLGSAAGLGSLAVPLSGGANTQLWRSDDAGAHWTQVGPYAGGTNLHGSLDSAGQPVLYDDGQLPPLNPPSPQAIQVSVDGGKTWQSAPAGANGQFGTSGILGTLGDGSVVEAFADTTTHQGFQVFSWKPGQAAWHQLGGNVHDEPQYLLVIPAGNGQETLWLVTHSSRSGGYDVQRLTL